MLMSVTHYIDLHVYRSSYMMCEDSFAINPPLLLEYYEAKIQMLCRQYEAFQKQAAMMLESKACVSFMSPRYSWQLKPLKTWRR